MLSIPDLLADWRLVLADVQTTQEQIPNGESNDQFDYLAPFCRNRDDAVAVPFADGFNRPDEPAIPVV